MHSIWEGGNTIRDIIVNAMVKRVVLENVYIVLLEGRTYIHTSTCVERAIYTVSAIDYALEMSL